MADTPVIFHYRGLGLGDANGDEQEHDEIPDDVTHIRVDSAVTEIGANAFRGRLALTKVELPEGLRKIGSNAFEDCRSLEFINLPSTLVLIGESAFMHCYSLSRIHVPSTVADIGSHAFLGCCALKTLKLHKGLHTIGDRAFLDCSSLLTVNIPSTVTDIGNRAFAQCSVLKSVELREGLRSMGDAAFGCCCSVISIDIPSTVTHVSSLAFSHCYALKTVKLHTALQSIGDNAFHSCKSLISIDIPSTVCTIGTGVFWRCSSLRSVQMHWGLLEIGRSAFGRCDSLLSINIPSTVTNIGNDTFIGCHLLRNISISQSIDVGPQTFPSLQNVDCSIDELRGRFNDLPVHGLCCAEPHQPMEDILSRLQEEVNKPGTHGLFQDCLGMTAIHCLACSCNRDINLFKLLVERYPDALICRDKWGATPLEYAMLTEVSDDIIHFLFQMHCNKWRALPFDFRLMVQKLAKKRGTSWEFLQSTIRAQRIYFSQLEIDWESIVNQSVVDDVPLEVFWVLVEASVSTRLVCMSSEHQTEIVNRVDNLADHYRIYKAENYRDVRRWVANYARMYENHLKEVTSILELALWRNMLEESRESRNPGRYNLRKKAKTSDPVSRGVCRQDCQAQVIIPNVLSFL